MVVNTLYLDAGILKSARTIYNKQNPKNLRLENFFQKPVYALLQKKLEKAKYSLKFHPYKYKYSIAKVKEVNSFLNGQYFAKIIKTIIRFKKSKLKYEIRKFERGNYTLLHDAEKEKPGIDFILSFSKNNNNFGGYNVYLTEHVELLQLEPFPNSISFVERKKGVMKFMKYVQHRQKFPIIQIIGTVARK